MKRLPLYLLFFLTLISCRSQNAGVYFNRPVLNECITLNEVGMMACRGTIKPIPNRMIIPETQDDYLNAKDYYLEREVGHYLCVVHPNRCP